MLALSKPLSQKRDGLCLVIARRRQRILLGELKVQPAEQHAQYRMVDLLEVNGREESQRVRTAGVEQEIGRNGEWPVCFEPWCQIRVRR